MAMEFENGAYVVYGKMGVCAVKERTVMSFASQAKEEYYALSPMRDPHSVVYVPCNNEKLMAKLRPLLTRQEIDDMLSQVSDGVVCWIENKNERTAAFHAILTQDDRRQLMRLIRCLYLKKQERLAAGKKLSSADESTLQECIRLVEEEFALVLDVPKSQVGEYIRQRVEE